MRQSYFKQKVEITTLPSVARNDNAILEVAAHKQVARDDVVSHHDWAATKQMSLRVEKRQRQSYAFAQEHEIAMLRSR
jgi:hypothetical protein